MAIDQGDAACWLDRVCDDCGAFVGDDPSHVCREPAAAVRCQVQLGNPPEVRRAGDDRPRC